MKMGLDAAPTADSSCLLSESEMTKSDAHNLQQHYGEVMSGEEDRLHHWGEARIIEGTSIALEVHISRSIPSRMFSVSLSLRCSMNF